MECRRVLFRSLAGFRRASWQSSHLSFRSGVKVVGGCLPGYEKKDDWIARMRGEGLQVHAAEGNVDDYESCADMFYQIGSVIGPGDILVNNAGMTRDGVFKRMSPADWYAGINTNRNGLFHVT